MNMVVSTFDVVSWSWGVGETFEAGTCPARLAQFVGDKADKHAKWRPEAMLIVGFDGNSLKKVPGYVNALSVKQRLVLENNSDVYLDSNLGLRCTTECISTAMQIVLLVPDANGDYDLSAARAKVRHCHLCFCPEPEP